MAEQDGKWLEHWNSDREYYYRPIVDDEGDIISYQDFIEKYQL